MMWWTVWCAAVVAGSAAAAPATSSDALGQLPSFDLAQMDIPTPDDEGLSYGESPMGGRFPAPWVYLLPDIPRDTQESRSVLPMRDHRSFSVNPAVDALQQGAYNKYMDRLRQYNRSYLDCIGKRDPRSPSDCKIRN